MLLKGERESRFVRLQARSSGDRKECTLAIIDITDIKRTEEEGPERLDFTDKFTSQISRR